MFRNYLKVAVRNLLKRKSYTFINVFGLATGMAVCLLIVLFIKSELGYDAFHLKSDRIYRVALERQYPERFTHYSFIPGAIGEAIKTEFPEVEESTRVFDFWEMEIFLSASEKRYLRKNVYCLQIPIFSGSLQLHLLPAMRQQLCNIQIQ